jgi:hypothetical protein
MLDFLAQAEHDGECAPIADPDTVADELLNIMMGLHVTSMLDPDAVTGSRQRYLMERALGRLVPSKAKQTA